MEFIKRNWTWIIVGFGMIAVFIGAEWLQHHPQYYPSDRELLFMAWITVFFRLGDIRQAIKEQGANK